MKTIEHISKVAENYRPVGKPIITGVEDFDKATDGGWRGGELVVLTGSQKAGKTAYTVWLAHEIAKSGVPILYFTYEMNPWYLKEKFEQLGEVQQVPIFLPLEHNDKTAEWIEERILEGKEKQATKIVFIDHLHYLIPLTDERRGNSSHTVGAVVRGLKQLAIKTDTIIVLVAHSRRLDKDERVSVNSIRDSALVANEADLVYTIERLKLKQKRVKTFEELMDGEMTNYSKVSLVANRRTGSQPFKLFTVERGRFVEMSRYEIEKIKDSVQI